MADGFSGPALVMDKITGLRSFSLNANGSLTSVSADYTWKDGEQTAECQYHPKGTLYEKYYGKNTHKVANSNCTCGFWAYFSGNSNRFHHSVDGVQGIIKGHGTVTVGTKGFRSEHAEIVALVDPWGRDLRPKPEKNEKKFSLGPKALFALWIIGLMMLNGGAILSNSVPSQSAIGIVVGIIGMIAMAASLVTFAVRGFISETAISGDMPEFFKARFDLTMEMYPNAKVYPSLAAAKKDFPLSDRPAT